MKFISFDKPQITITHLDDVLFILIRLSVSIGYWNQFLSVQVIPLSGAYCICIADIDSKQKLNG
jgi:hypothetical protein